MDRKKKTRERGRCRFDPDRIRKATLLKFRELRPHMVMSSLRKNPSVDKCLTEDVPLARC